MTAMFFRGLIHSIKQGFRQIFRNRAMMFASLFSITAMLLLLGLFFILVVNVNMMTETAKKQFDTVQIYFLDGTSRKEATVIADKFKEMEEVASVEYVSKARAMEEFKVKFGEKAYLLEGLRNNPLPNSLRVKVTAIEDADKVVAMANKLDGVDEIRYYQTTVDQLLQVTRIIKLAALIVIVFLIVVSVVVVSNTVKLTVLAREREISIMKYVGATNWFIRGPFLVEGILIGIFSAIISIGLISLVYYKLIETLEKGVIVMFSTALVPEKFLIINLVWIFTALGTSIGAFGSITSMRRFLDT